MSNFADMAYDNYLMHYRTKGSKNGYTKDPDYTPVGERAKVEREKAARRNEINMRSGQARRGDYAGMPTSALEAKERANEIRERGRSERATAARRNEINMHSGQARRGDYAGMPSSVLDAQAKAKEEKRDRMKSKAEAKRKSEYMKAKAEAKRKKESEINRLSKQKTRGDYAGMPSSALKAKEKTERASEINRLSKQKTRGDYAGMPSSARAAIENAERAKRAKEISERAKLERFKAEARNKNLMWEAWRRKWKNQRGY